MENSNGKAVSDTDQHTMTSHNDITQWHHTAQILNEWNLYSVSKPYNLGTHEHTLFNVCLHCVHIFTRCCIWQFRKWEFLTIKCLYLPTNESTDIWSGYESRPLRMSRVKGTAGLTGNESTRKSHHRVKRIYSHQTMWIQTSPALIVYRPVFTNQWPHSGNVQAIGIEFYLWRGKEFCLKEKCLM